LGYYLNKIDFSKEKRGIIYIFGAAGFLGTVFTTYLASQRTLLANSNYYSSFTLCTLAQSAAVFVFCKYYRWSESVQSRIWASLSKASFGIYWIHPLLLDMLKEKMMVDTLTFFPAMSVPAISIIVFALSFAVSWVIGKIPLLKRCIV
jgi:surface polysaccharide O-acyltransferase-like enzyme